MRGNFLISRLRLRNHIVGPLNVLIPLFLGLGLEGDSGTIKCIISLFLVLGLEEGDSRTIKCIISLFFYPFFITATLH